MNNKGKNKKNNKMIESLILRKPEIPEEFDAMYDLRWRTLREPWNQPKGSEKDDSEDISIPIIAILDGKIIGTARLHKVEDKLCQFRYLAVEEKFRRRGVATAILHKIEEIAKKQGFQSVFLNARKSAKDVFIKQGFEIVGEGSTIFGVIEHFKMRKSLL